MNPWLGFLGYEAVWFAAVIGAEHGLAWPGVLAFVLFAGWQCAVSRQRRTELKLILLAVICGLIIDGSLASSGLVRYAVSGWSLPPGGAPLWILALWGAFALTLMHCLHYLQRNLAVAVLLGAVGGPLAYACAGRVWGVVHFSVPAWHALTALSVGWAVAMGCLAGMARYWSGRSLQTSVEVRHERV